MENSQNNQMKKHRHEHHANATYYELIEFTLRRFNNHANHAVTTIVDNHRRRRFKLCFRLLRQLNAKQRRFNNHANLSVTNIV